MLGRPRSELIGKGDFDLVPAEEARVYWEREDEVFRTGQPLENEEALTDATGLRHWILTRKSLINLPDGRRYLLCVISDVNERKRAEARLMDAIEKIGRAHVCTPFTNAHLVCRLMLQTKKTRS